MGAVRKVASVATLGVVHFRSHAEQLERELDRAHRAQEIEAIARLRAEQRAAAATDELRSSRRRRRRHEAATLAGSLSSAVTEVGHAVSGAVESADVPTVAEVVDGAKQASRRVRRRAGKATARAAELTAR